MFAVERSRFATRIATRIANGNQLTSRIGALLITLFLASMAAAGVSSVPGVFNFQGRISVGGNPYSGTALFKFSLVDSQGTNTWWSNDGSGASGNEPTTAVPIAVSKGLYSILLGDTSIPGMTQAIGPSAVSTGPVYLRIWFNDGTNGTQLLHPDQRLASTAFALVAASVPPGAITRGMLAPGALAASDLVGTVSPAALPSDVALKSTDLTALSNAFAAQLTALSNQFAMSASVAIPGLTAASTDPVDQALIQLGFNNFASIPAPAWVSRADSPDVPPRQGHGGAWTDHGFAVWGGRLAAGRFSGTGAFYQPGTDRWTDFSPAGAPSARADHLFYWTGSEVLVWGGSDAFGFLPDGARYAPAARLWTPINPTNRPSGRILAASAWTGDSLIVWGGLSSQGLLADGGLYSPTDDQWSPIPADFAPVRRAAASGLWCGDRFIVWGGHGDDGAVNSGAQLLSQNGVPTAWQPISTNRAPSPRSGHTAIWTGSRMIVFGGVDSVGQPKVGTPLGDGAMYDPLTDTWAPLPSTGAPSARGGHIAVWTGTEMLIQGGLASGVATATGAAFNPSLGTWRDLSTDGGPISRGEAVGAWDGKQLYVFGGTDGANPLADLQRLTPQPAWYFYRKP